jgi:hypothetical protein
MINIVIFRLFHKIDKNMNFIKIIYDIWYIYHGFTMINIAIFRLFQKLR